MQTTLPCWALLGGDKINSCYHPIPWHPSVPAAGALLAFPVWAMSAFPVSVSRYRCAVSPAKSYLRTLRYQVPFSQPGLMPFLLSSFSPPLRPAVIQLRKTRLDQTTGSRRLDAAKLYKLLTELIVSWCLAPGAILPALAIPLWEKDGKKTERHCQRRLAGNFRLASEKTTEQGCVNPSWLRAAATAARNPIYGIMRNREAEPRSHPVLVTATWPRNSCLIVPSHVPTLIDFCSFILLGFAFPSSHKPTRSLLFPFLASSHDKVHEGAKEESHPDEHTWASTRAHSTEVHYIVPLHTPNGRWGDLRHAFRGRLD